MTGPESIAEETLQDYLDGRLSDRRRAEVAAYLAKHPQKAAEIEALRYQDDTLRSLGAEILEEPVPERLTAVLRSAGGERAAPHGTRSSRLMQSAAALLIFALGGVLGWAVHSQMQRSPSEIDLVLSDASFAFSSFANDEAKFFNFGPEQDAELAVYSERVFKRSITRPNLTELGLMYQGARILPNARRLVGYFLFQDDEGTRVSITVWPSTLPPNRNVITSRMNDVQTRFWLEDNLGFAVMGGGDGVFLDEIAEHVFAHYQAPAGG